MMKANNVIKTTTVTHFLIMILMLSFQEAIAVEYYTPSLPEISAPFEVSLYLSIITPSMLVEESGNRRRNRERKERKNAEQRKEEALRRKAQMNVPDMVVKEIIITPPIPPSEKETWNIRLEDTDNPENHAILKIHFPPDYKPMPEDNIPIGRIQEGDKVTFETSTHANGWTLHNDAGERLIFVPVNDVQMESFSESF